MKPSLFLALSAFLGGCSTSALPEMSSPNPSDPRAPVVAAPYASVLAGTAVYEPGELKPWRKLNDSVAPRAGRSP